MNVSRRFYKFVLNGVNMPARPADDNSHGVNLGSEIAIGIAIRGHRFLPQLGSFRVEAALRVRMYLANSGCEGRPSEPPGAIAERLPQMFPARRQSSQCDPRRNSWRNPPLNASPAPVASTIEPGSARCLYTTQSHINMAPLGPSLTTGTRTQSCSFSSARSAFVVRVTAHASCSLGKMNSQYWTMDIS